MSANRNFVLKNVLKSQLVALCEMRWTQHHDAVIKFLSELPNVVDSLEHISLWKDASSATKARILFLSVKGPQFVVALHCLADVLSLTLTISQFLQKESANLSQAAIAIDNVLEVLRSRRQNSESQFAVTFQAATSMLQSLGSF